MRLLAVAGWFLSALFASVKLVSSIMSRGNVLVLLSGSIACYKASASRSRKIRSRRCKSSSGNRRPPSPSPTPACGRLPKKPLRPWGACSTAINTAPPQLPEHLSQYQRLLDKLVEKDRDARFRNADEVIGFLSRNFEQDPASDKTERLH